MEFEPRPASSQPSPVPPPLPPPAAPPFAGTYPPLPPPPPRRRPVAVVIVVAVVVAFGGVAVFVARQWFAPRRTSPAETAEQKYRAAREAFAAGTPGATGADPNDEDAIDGLLTRLGQALSQRRGAVAAAMFDLDRMAEETMAQPGAAGLGRRVRRDIAAELKRTMGQNLGAESGLDGWTRHQVRRVQMLPGGEEAVVFARHWDEDDTSFRFRWWVRRRGGGGGWKVYDYEELTEGQRVTVAMSVLAGAATGRGPAPWLATYRHVQAAMLANAKGDFDAAETSLRRADGVTLPGPFEANRWTAWGTAHLGRGRFAESVEAVDKASAAAPEMPLADFLRASAYLGMGEAARSLASARRFDDTLGADADNLHTMGLALESLGRTAEATDAYRRALDDDPNSSDNLSALALILPDETGAELAARFARAALPRQQFETVADELAAAGDEDALKVLVDAYVAKRGKDAASAAYAARLRMGREEYDAAADELRDALAAATTDEDRASLHELYLSAMRSAGQSVRAYKEAPDRAAAFEQLASQMSPSDHAAALRELVEARRADAPDDFGTHYYDGQAHEATQAYEAAEAAYARAAAAGGDEAQLERLRDARVYFRYARGQGLSALGELGPADKTFAQLASLYAGDEDAGGLGKLVEARRATDPGDRELRLWDAEVKWLGKDYGAAADGFLEYYAVAGAESSADDRLVRSLVRAARFGEALPHAKRYQRMHGESFYVLLVHAAAGDVPAATAAFAQCLKEGSDVDDLYTAEDLGPLLEAEAFAPLRAAHPRPAAPATSEATSRSTPPTAGTSGSPATSSGPASRWT